MVRKFPSVFFLLSANALKGPVIQVTFLFNLSRNIVALQVDKNVAKSRARLYFVRHVAATLKFVARQVEHAVVIRATTRSTCNATMLRDKLNKSVARITGSSGSQSKFKS